ncbi:hypothetical protein [Saccharothrix sp. NRRL B-16314]|nr:hypothetical protein [Saccharothrix sp. NRRL B-16314]
MIWFIVTLSSIARSLRELAQVARHDARRREAGATGQTAAPAPVLTAE